MVDGEISSKLISGQRRLGNTWINAALITPQNPSTGLQRETYAMPNDVYDLQYHNFLFSASCAAAKKLC
jgi:hypothetical protein